ncbi:MAG: M48 family metallopeptidase [Verrucomicrobia bacterium]|nr:M48 family metallopeptidase [Verrucomicrobiota bacterium]
MSGFFYNLGRHVGRAAVPTIRKSKWIWDGLTGTEDEALRAEAAFGSALAVELRAVTGRVDDPQMAALLNDLCRRLAACVRDKRRVFRCEAIRDDSPNAMALPGGFVFVSHSLVDLCERRPEELAFVIGHEMAHIIREHAWNRMMKEVASSVLSRAVSVLAARAGPLAGWLREKGMALLQSAHSQDHEQEADELGLHLVAAAGLAPGGAIALLQRIERLDPKRMELGRYFASHPPAAERIARLMPLCRRLTSGRP